MKKLILAITMIMVVSTVSAQVSNYKFGKGFQIYSKDSSFAMNFGLRFQNLISNEWNVNDDDLGDIGSHQSNFLIRRARLKWAGYAFTPKLKYKVELGLSNRDMSGGDSPEYSNASRMILDSWLEWNFAGNFSIWAGQGKMHGNRERLVSSANLQFVDRSRLNSRYTLDRDVGLMLKHHFKIGDNFIVREVVSFAQGEGRNVTSSNPGGYASTFKVEILPFGKFQSKGDYKGGDLKRESKPKLAIAAAYDINNNAIRERGQKGSYIQDMNGAYVGKTLNTFFADMMFKYKGFSLMAEFANRQSADGDQDVYDDSSNVIGTYYTGQALNVQVGYLLKSNYEFALRLTSNRPEGGVANENEYGIAFSKYFVGHKLKIQTDIHYRQKYLYETTPTTNQGSNDKLYWRVQMDIHF